MPTQMLALMELELALMELALMEWEVEGLTLRELAQMELELVLRQRELVDLAL